MDAERNPYTPGAGTPPPELAGREELLSTVDLILSRLKGGKTNRGLILRGLRGVGKTVLLNRIGVMADNRNIEYGLFEANEKASILELLLPRLYQILLKLDKNRRLGHDIQNIIGFMRSFAAVFTVKYEGFEFGISESRATGDMTLDLSDLFVAISEAAKSRQTGVGIFVDELQYLSNEELTSLVLALHRVSQKSLPLFFVGAGLPVLGKLVGLARTYAERMFLYPNLGPLERENVERAFVLPAREEMNVEFSSDALEELYHQTGGYPFFIQLWGYHVWNKARGQVIEHEDVLAAEKDVITDLDQNFYRTRFDRLTDRQMDYVVAMAELKNPVLKSASVAAQMGLAPSRAAPIRQECIRQGVIFSPERGEVAFTVPRCNEYLKRRRRSPGE